MVGQLNGYFLSNLFHFSGMQFSAKAINLGSNKISTRDIIISVLGVRWPLQTKEIFQIAKREYGHSGTYQAVHKMLGELVEQEVLTKSEDGYSLNIEWVKGLKLFSEKLNKAYSQEKSLNIQNKDVVNLYFENFIEVIRFIIHDLYESFPNWDQKPEVCLMRHAVLPVGATEKDWMQMKKIFSRPYYGLYKFSTPLDIFANTTTVALGKKSIEGIEYPADGDLIIHGDYVAQIFFPVDFRKKLDALFKKFKPSEKLDFRDVFEVYSSKTSIKVVISRNPALAEYLRSNAIDTYEKYRKDESVHTLKN